MSIHEVQIGALGGGPLNLNELKGKAALIVNVASQCGLTPQYEGLERIHERLSPRGFTVLGVPCNQFAGQEPGTPDEIAAFCSTNYGVTFPLTEKVEVNGPGRHPLFDALTATPDPEGKSGDVAWNFEKFLIAPDGSIAGRFRPLVEPESEELLAAIEEVLPD